MNCHVAIPVVDATSVGEVRRAVIGVAASFKLGETDAGRASIVATELATNLVRHASPASRVILVGAEPGAIELTATDTGPGMADVRRCFEDGYSTAGTPGNGLGAVKRLSDEHDIYSTPAGTVLWCRIIAGAVERLLPGMRTPIRGGGLSIPMPGETECGDAWRMIRGDDGAVSIVVADGLGHGPIAAEASTVACRVFESHPFDNPRALLERMNTAMAGTRGAAVAIAHIDAAATKLTYAGVGNIAGWLRAADGTSRGLFSHNGIVGHQMRKVQVFEYPLSLGSTLVLHSDGVQTRWDLAKFPGLLNRHPAIVAGLLIRDFKRGRDDATAVVIYPAHRDA